MKKEEEFRDSKKCQNGISSKALQMCDPTLSVICVYNDKETLDRCLLSTLENQTIQPNLILIDNSKGEFKSAASALNHGASKATGKYLLFAHQDISLYSNNFLEEIERSLESLPNLGIAGAAGKIDHGGILTNITCGNPPRYAGGKRRIGITEPVRVQTLDECLFIVPKSVFCNLRFDESSCDGWHLYAVDYSLSVLKLGLNAYAVPVSVHHMSEGRSMSEAYFTTLKKLFRKHKREYSWIYTTMGDWRTAYPVCYYRILYRRTLRPT